VGIFSGDRWCGLRVTDYGSQIIGDKWQPAPNAFGEGHVTGKTVAGLLIQIKILLSSRTWSGIHAFYTGWASQNFVNPSSRGWQRCIQRGGEFTTKD